MALDLADEERFSVTVADVKETVLEELQSRQPKLETIREDLSDPSKVTELVAGYDIVINAVPGFMGYATLAAVIEARRDVVDISFFAEDPFSLNDRAVAAGVTAVVDCGVSPGLSNLLIGRVAAQLDRIDNVLIYVGGLPELRHWPYEYKAVFSPIDVIEEYVRPARYVENGATVIRPALSDPEFIDFPGIGTLEAFNTDGLRSLAQTISSPNMKEKTLRYPGHIEKMAVLREAGFFDEAEIVVDGATVRPIDFTAALLFPNWKMGPGEADITVLRVLVEGRQGDREVRHVFRMLDRYDPQTDTLSMARTTGYTATAAVRMLSQGLYDKPGIAPPEMIGRHKEPCDFMIRCLRERQVRCEEEVSGGSPILN
jgi:saccharopine dehydrogenase-like NADP-dependent oxidoreductase